MLKRIHSIFNRSPWDNEDDKPQKSSPNIKKDYFNFFNQFNLNNFINPYFVFLGLMVIILLWLSSGIYKLNEGEEGLILRFGKFVRIDKPGLNFHFPEPIDKVIIEQVDKSRRLEIGYRSTNQRQKLYKNTSEDNNIKYLPEESIMLTGDVNMIELNCDVVWRINDLKEYLFFIVDPENTVKAAAESAIREVIGKTPISYVLSNQKQDIAEKIQNLLQKMLTLYNAGISIDYVQLLKAEPPVDVIAAYRDVQTSYADKEKEINQALAFKNDILPRARGEAAKLIEEAKGYSQEVVSKAEGETKRFNLIYKEYITSKYVTKDRMYFDVVENIMGSNNKTIIPDNVLLPHMNIQSNNNTGK